MTKGRIQIVYSHLPKENQGAPSQEQSSKLCEFHSQMRKLYAQWKSNRWQWILEIQLCHLTWKIYSVYLLIWQTTWSSEVTTRKRLWVSTTVAIFYGVFILLPCILSCVAVYCLSKHHGSCSKFRFCTFTCSCCIARYIFMYSWLSHARPETQGCILTWKTG